MEATVVNYTWTTEVIANPERWFQKYSKTQASSYSLISPSTLSNYINTNKITVLYRSFLLDSFMTSDISQSFLDNMQIDFDRIRNAWLKVIVRFSYTDEDTAGEYQASKAQILTHITQLESILEANKDIIFAQQAGFIGKYGEWYYTNSSVFWTDWTINATQWNHRKDIILAMLAHTPVEIPIQVRYVGIKQTMFGTTPLNSSTAYQNTPNARIGFYNDAFLNDYGDQWTYDVSGRYTNPVGTPEYVYLSNETKYLPMGWETNWENFPRTEWDNAIEEMDLTNFSTLNRDYYIPNFTNWIAAGYYDEIERRLWYRFVLTQSNYDFSNNVLSWSINITNEGFARPFHNKTVNLVVKKTDNSATYKYNLNSDIRTWESTATLNFTQNVSAINNGTYDLFLEIIDPLLPTRVEYSIRLANENTWVDNMNSLNYQFTKSSVVAPALTVVTPVSTPTNDTTPNFTFSSTQPGSITYGGSCSSATSSAITGSNTVTFNSLSNGTYTNCTVRVTNSLGTLSNTLAVPSFTIDTSAANAPSLVSIWWDNSSPYFTTDTTPTLYWTGTSGDTITLTVSGVIFTWIVNISGAWNISISQALNSQTHTITMSAINSLGSTSSIVTGNFTIDTDTPSLVLIGSNPLIISYGWSYTDPGATWMDTIDGTGIVYGTTTWASINTSIPWNYTLVYQYTDHVNHTGSITRTVTVRNKPTSSWGGGAWGGWTITNNTSTTTTTNNTTSTNTGSSTSTTSTGTHSNGSAPTGKKITFTQEVIYNESVDNWHCHPKKSTISIVDSRELSTNEEFKRALAFLYVYDMTMFNTIDKFQPNMRLTRQQAAKIFTNFATNVLCRNPDTSIQPSYSDVGNVSTENKKYITQAYQLWLMKGWKNNTFKPFKEISKAEFNAVLIRLILDTKLSENSDIRYEEYNRVATEIGIITQWADSTPLARKNATLMLFRAYKNQSYEENSQDNSFVLEDRDQFIP